MSDKIDISKFDFDQYWVGANLDRIERLMAHEIEALIDYHWEMLVQEVVQGIEREKENNVQR